MQATQTHTVQNSMVTKAQADGILAEPKVIAANLVWRFDRRGYRIEAAVLAEESAALLKLVGYVGRRNRSFALLYRNTPIRKYTVHPLHIDYETGERTTEPHKHTWDETHRDRKVYLPDDIRIGNPNAELQDFLQECNIILRGSYVDEEFSRLAQGDLL